MNYIDRRDFVKTTGLTLGSVMLTGFRDSELPANPVQIHPAGITVLMADRAKRNDSLKEVKEDHPPKRYWIDNWAKPDDSFQWAINNQEDAAYEVAMLISGGPDIEVEIAGSRNRLTGKPRKYGWDRITATATLLLPKGLSTITVRLRDGGEGPVKSLELERKENDWAERRGSGLHFKSLELTPIAARQKIEKRIKAIRSDARWLAEAGYGLMFQWGDWGYPPHGDRNPWPKMIDDFDVNSFARMIEGTGAGYVIWSVT